MESSQAYFPPSANKKHVLLTWAQSINGRIGYVVESPSLGQLRLSSKESFVMTHLLRTKFDGIMVGSRTAENDNPSLTAKLPDPANPDCLLPLNKQPIPIIVDSNLRLDYASLKVIRLARERLGKPPLIIVAPSIWQQVQHDNKLKEAVKLIQSVGGRCIIRNEDSPDSWSDYVALDKLLQNGVNRIMVEGGAELLAKAFGSTDIDAYVVTIVPKIFSCSNTTEIKNLNNLNLTTNSHWYPCGPDVIFTNYSDEFYESYKSLLTNSDAI
ncbi:2,5-diamino-6-ribosylamino-4(3H)-pyrimidinone 5''-phosphate reductase [Schizosaccharomyces pombe]